jgi:hypothetical protein
VFSSCGALAQVPLAGDFPIAVFRLCMLPKSCSSCFIPARPVFPLLDLAVNFCLWLRPAPCVSHVSLLRFLLPIRAPAPWRNHSRQFGCVALSRKRALVQSSAPSAGISVPLRCCLSPDLIRVRLFSRCLFLWCQHGLAQCSSSFCPHASSIFFVRFGF